MQSRVKLQHSCQIVRLRRALMLGWVLAMAGLGWPAAGQTVPVFTNLAQVTLAEARTNGLTGKVKLNATVFACSTNSGVLVLADGSGVGLLELGGLKSEFEPGDRVEVEGDPGLIGAGDLGLVLCLAPTVDNDGLHSVRRISREGFFEAGRYPLRLDWFNQFAAFELGFSCVAVDSQSSPPNAPADSVNLIHAIRAECFQGNWKQLPNFQFLQPVKAGSVSNFDIGFRTRDSLVGIRFEGYFEAPKSGLYRFSLSSDDGSRLWIGTPEVSVKKVGKEARPAAPPAIIGQSMSGLYDHCLATLEGRVDFVTRVGKGLQFEIRSDRNPAWIAMADAGNLAPEQLLNKYVRVSGVAGAVITENQRIVLGKLAVATSRELTIIEGAANEERIAPVLRSSMEVQSLSGEDAARHLPVAVKGVVTAMGYGRSRWMVLQDDTRGIFVNRSLVTNCLPNIGEFWDVSGYTETGNFAPVVIAERASLIGKGRLPEPGAPGLESTHQRQHGRTMGGDFGPGGRDSDQPAFVAAA